MISEFSFLQEESDTDPMLASTDPKEIQKFYQNFCKKNISEDQHTKAP